VHSIPVFSATTPSRRQNPNKDRIYTRQPCESRKLPASASAMTAGKRTHSPARRDDKPPGGVRSIGLVPEQSIPRLQNQPLRPVLPELPLLLLLEDTERLARVVGAHDVRRVEDVAELVAGQAVEARVVGVQLRAQHRPPLGVPRERVTLVSQVLCPRPQVLRRVRQLEDAGDDEVEVGRAIGSWRKRG